MVWHLVSIAALMFFVQTVSQLITIYRRNFLDLDDTLCYYQKLHQALHQSLKELKRLL